MKFNVPSKALYQAVSAVSKIINSKNTLTILDNFLVELGDGVLTITGSDTDNALTAKVEVTDQEGTGSMCIGARRFVEMLKEIPDQGIEVQINDSTLEIEILYSSGKYNLVALEGSQYPRFSTADDTADPIVVEMPGEYLVKGFENTVFAVSTDDYRPVMQGVLLDLKPESLTFVATDTRKLVRYIDNRVKCGAEASRIMPTKPATVLRSVIDKESVVTMTIHHKWATITCGNISLTCSFLVGNYPPYNRVIPQGHPYHVNVDRQTLLTAVRRVQVFVDPAFALEKFRFSPECIQIKTDDTAALTMARDKVACSYTGPELVMGFSAVHLGDILSTISTEDVIIDLADPSKPGVFRPSENVPETDLVMLLMPMTVTEF